MRNQKGSNLDVKHYDHSYKYCSNDYQYHRHCDQYL